MTQPIRNKPMSFLEEQPKGLLSAVMEITLIEMGSRERLRNLLNHATQRSAFWRSRIGNIASPDVDLASAADTHAAETRKQSSFSVSTGSSIATKK